jgi:peptidoglycan/xylan/chitin deacetylase (PgdA/CDA1 family)
MIQKSKKINILLYHQIDEAPSFKTNLDCFCSTKEFYKQMDYLKNSEFKVISLNMALDLIFNNKEITSNYIVLTFDDGCEKFYDTTFPILDSFNFTATVYPITGFLGESLILNKKNYPHLKVLSKNMLMDLSKMGVNIGAHSVNHPKLTNVSIKEAEFQIKQCKDDLEQLLAKKIDSFSYPHGDFDKKIIKLVKNYGYTNALTCKNGFAQDAKSRFEIPRNYITYFDKIENFIKKLT